MTFQNNDIKLYQIDKNFFELRSLNSSSEIINFIINYHQEKFESEFEIEDNVSEMNIGDVLYSLYVFDEIEQESKWKSFLPSEITNNHNFNVVSTSFALFITIENYIFSLIGGKGISVIKRFINHSFGLDFYEKIAEPENDIVHSVTTRGITGSLSSEAKTYRSNQKLQDALHLGAIPIKLNLLLREDVKNSIFDFIEFDDDENIYIEIGSSFCLKWTISFPQANELVLKAVQVLNSTEGRPISRFEKIRDPEFCDDILKNALYTHLRDDMVRLNTNESNNNYLLDYDFIHPSKLIQFYECDYYHVYLKNGRTPIYETRDRTKIYFETLKYIYENDDQMNLFEFRKEISGIRVKGYVGETKKTEAPFINHISCELTIDGRPYFLLDNIWYQVRGDFIDAINNQCSSLLVSSELLPNPMTKNWILSEMDEGEYNLLYLNEPNFIVLDKMLGQNIELCDLLYETNEIIYLIHIKVGFDAKMRDVTNQVSVSSQRLWNDINSDFAFINSVYARYNNSNNNVNNLTLEQFKSKFEKKIIYVIAFCHGRINMKVTDNIRLFQSNIAKFSLIQSMKEMQSNSYPLQVVEINNGSFQNE